jgi:hypothetical protein
MGPDFRYRFGNHAERLDYPLFQPPQDWETGIIYCASVPPWKIISWWDRSVDSRPGSHSTFVGNEFKNHHELVLAAMQFFPAVFVRQPAAPRMGPYFFP